MKKWIDFFEPKERRVIAGLGLLLLAAVVFLLAGLVRERHRYFTAKRELAELEKKCGEALAAKEEKEMSWKRWEEARRDIEDIRKNNFYQDSRGVELRMNLRTILAESGVRVSQIEYTYLDLAKGKIKKAVLSFNISGSYLAIKKFLDSVEKLPKFLMVEKIDFQSIRPDDGSLELRVSLVGYYEG
jgi:Tfp pilus assembly protein PilO